MAEKTEKATPKKLRDARKKGQVAKSQDFPSAFTFVASIATTLYLSHFIFESLSAFIILCFRGAQDGDQIIGKVGGYLNEAFMVIFNVSIPIGLFVAIIGVITNFLIIGPVFSLEAMKFEFKKLNPIQGIKQKFKLKTFIELIKSILKITGAAIIIFWVMWSSIPQAISTVAMPVMGSADVLDNFLITVTIRVGIFFLLIAIFDLSFQKKNFAKEMKMEKFEVKQEYKDSEGDPQIKGKRKELSREIAYQDGPSAAKRAKAIITNPTHIAVAIGYDEEEDPAPIILTMGQNIVAEKIVRIATEERIPVMRNPDLAQTLYRFGKPSDYIPEDTYQAIAEILKWVSSLEENPDANVELFT